MITLEKIISGNLDMLKSQEQELLKSLNFVRKALDLFSSQNGGTRKRKKRSAPAKAAPAKAKPAKAKKGRKAKKAKKAKGKAKTGKSGDTRLSRIIAVLKQKNAPIPSGDLIDTLFKQQKEDKNLGHFRQLVYTTLTQAYKKGIVKRKNGKLSLS